MCMTLLRCAIHTSDHGILCIVRTKAKCAISHFALPTTNYLASTLQQCACFSGSCSRLWSLLVNAEAATSKLSSTDDTKIDSVFEDRVLTANYNVGGNKRSLRRHDDVKEERALPTSISNLVNRGKDALTGTTTSLSAQAKKMYEKLLQQKFIKLYNKGETPLTLRAKRMGTDNEFVAKYKAFWDFVRKNGNVPKPQ
ncbi:hypothetical protein PHYSODRAFT_285868 [Phytophthora sojae]|uniref:RxLR effector protein n=1 Tax=Phytophthora sojae (strain P6497) TaxID=1094619 RepID=G4ZFY1_PHYSP|nr:hypothetical protein PHYSODRAFT_285868 [Phytophthora sojae]EGZ17048.1 hypothetical protein PHYSODRAFT_285868 [Phytophthora sojae]|eukprot:XP_009526106.1 hypothetical protein PHYSODRAFT_285868 [Phytophthora sojae]